MTDNSAEKRSATTQPIVVSAERYRDSRPVTSGRRHNTQTALEGSTRQAEQLESVAFKEDQEQRDLQDRPEHFIAGPGDIAERRRVEDAPSQSEGLYRTVVDHAAESILLIDIGTSRILEANATLCRSLGYTAEELKGMTLYDIVAHDQEKAGSNVQTAAEKRIPLMGEVWYRRKDGALVNVEVSASSIPYGDVTVTCIFAHDVTERKRAKQRLQQSLDALLAIYKADHILGSTLEAEEIGSRLLQLIQQISGSVTAVMSVPDDHGQLQVWQSIGLENLWRRVRYTPIVQTALWQVMKSGEHALLRVGRPNPDAQPGPDSTVGLFLPLKVRNRVLGVLEVYGPHIAQDKSVLNTLLDLTTKAASAFENAQLYGKLAERERQLHSLVGKLIVAQEKERRRVSYEVHDGPTQQAVAAFQRLQAFAHRYPPDSSEGRQALETIVDLAQRTVGESRQIIENLRPTALDDFGLPTALRLQVEDLRSNGWRVSYEENLGDRRVTDVVETALYRVAQEALTNVRKHVQDKRIRVRLRVLRKVIRLQIRDWGCGFNTAFSVRSGPGERVGLASMRERVALVGGELKVHSIADVGTMVTADVPLPSTTGIQAAKSGNSEVLSDHTRYHKGC